MTTEQRFGTLTIDRDGRRVHLDGHVVHLTKSEFALLSTLAAHPGSALSNRDLLESMWGDRWQADTTPLQVHVSRLRHKLGESGSSPRYIVTVHGFGYRFDADPRVLTEHELTPADLVRLESASTAPNVVHLLASRDRRIRWVCHTVETVLGAAVGEVEGMHVYEFFTPEDRASAATSREELDHGHPVAVRGYLRTVAGGRWRVEALVRPVIGDDGAVTGFLGEFHPLGASPGNGDPPLRPVVLSEQALDGSATHAVTLTVDRELMLRGITPHGRVLGWEPEEILGTVFSPAGRDAATVRSVVDGMVAIGAVDVTGTVVVRYKDGGTAPVEAETTIEFDDDGMFAGLRTTLHLPDKPLST